MRRGAVVVFLALPTVVLSAQGSARHTQEPAVRQVFFQEGRDLLRELRKTDRMLEVIRVGAPGFVEALPDGMTQIEASTRFAEAVGIVKVVKRVGAFTHARDWIDSTVTAVVLEVLKSTKMLSLTDEQEVSFPEYGGDIRLIDQTIVASSSWAAPLAIGRTYLIFLRTLPQGAVTTEGPTGTFEVLGAQLRRLSKNQRESAIDAQPVFDEIKTSAHLPQLRVPAPQ